MLRVSEAAKAWHEAMTNQDLHELDCQPCRANRTPVCAEGKRLQQAAHTAWRAWVAAEYAGRVVA